MCNMGWSLPRINPINKILGKKINIDIKSRNESSQWTKTDEIAKKYNWDYVGIPTNSDKKQVEYLIKRVGMTKEDANYVVEHWHDGE